MDIIFLTVSGVSWQQWAVYFSNCWASQLLIVTAQQNLHLVTKKIQKIIIIVSVVVVVIFFHQIYFILHLLDFSMDVVRSGS